ncbi:MAG TPA: class I SAM-dependent rRNA methyltransferase [Sulfuricurvum sp.]|nr:class I SAM-dependent rRNA methyltransferase [Sulfuricurvum sp.]HQT37343.1 class I SAM-dependent rRNA methyltransferase [Sulfuricurvum sp.]
MAYMLPLHHQSHSVLMGPSGKQMKNVTITKIASHKLKSFFCWVYQNELVTPIDAIDGEVIDVLSHNGEFLGRGYINQKSKISVRILTFAQREIDQDFFTSRLKQALAKRQNIVNSSDAYRVVHSEADFLPGLIVDWYNGYAAIQINTLGMECFRKEIIQGLIEVLNPKGIFDKSDMKVRQIEGIETQNGVIYGEVPQEISIAENGISFVVNLYEGQKTGFYLDQRHNRQAVAKYIDKDDKVLDVFCNAGGFGLYALKNGAQVRFVDLADHALAQVAQNITLNGFEECEIIKQDAFDFLTLEKMGKNTYDCIVLDPPPFAKTKKEAEGAIKGFKFLLSAALKLLNENGIVAVFSCSHHVAMNDLLELSLEASTKARVPLEVIELLRADEDHPYMLNIPNSAYLSGVVLRKSPL